MTDLKELLCSAAAKAENVSVDGSALIPAIRRRRRVRTAAVGVGTVAAATTLAVTAYAVLPGAAPVEAPVSGGAAPSAPWTDDCEPTYISARTQDPKVELTQQSMHPREKNQWVGVAKVRITNPYKVKLYTTNAPSRYWIVPVQGDQHVAGRALYRGVPKKLTLQPGASHVSEIQLVVEGCRKGGTPAGSYLIYNSTMDIEGKVYRNGPITGLTPVGRLDLP